MVSNCDLPKMVEPATWQPKEIPNEAKQNSMQRDKLNAQPGTQKLHPVRQTALEFSNYRTQRFLTIRFRYTLHFRCLEMIKAIS